MERLKIIINKDKSIAKEAKKLFKELEYYVSSNLHDNKYGWVIGQTGGDYINDISWFDKCHAELITIQQLRDLVVLKRNSPKDANGKNHRDELIYEALDGVCYVHDGEKWVKSYYQSKPIEKEMKMKEYLEKQEDGTYKLVMRSDTCKGGDIEVPDGAEQATLCNGYIIFWKGSKYSFSIKEENKWCYKRSDVSIYFDFNEYMRTYGDAEIVWQRSTQHVDNKTTLNDQYAEIEQVRKSAWNKQTGGDHYKKLAIQPMEYALKNKLDYAQANVVKYITRHADKNGKEDLLKAIHNIELIIEHYYS